MRHLVLPGSDMNVYMVAAKSVHQGSVCGLGIGALHRFRKERGRDFSETHPERGLAVYVVSGSRP